MASDEFRPKCGLHDEFNERLAQWRQMHTEEHKLDRDTLCRKIDRVDADVGEVSKEFEYFVEHDFNDLKKEVFKIAGNLKYYAGALGLLMALVQLAALWFGGHK